MQKNQITGNAGFKPGTPGNVILSEAIDSGRMSAAFVHDVGGALKAQSNLSGLQDAGTIIMGNTDFKNEIISYLWNRIVDEFFSTRYWTNKWAFLKKGMMTPGFAVEEIFTEVAKGFNFDDRYVNGTDTEFYSKQMPDVKAVVHTLNTRRYYEVTVNNQSLRAAFTTYNGLERLIGELVNSLYRGAELDDWLILKYCLGRAIIDGSLKAINGGTVTATTVNEFVTKMKETSDLLDFQSPNYNEAGVINFCPFEDQFYILPASVNALVKVNSLAVAFNRSDREFMGRYLPVDHFNFETWEQERLDNILKEAYNTWYKAFTDDENTALATIPGVIVDRNFFQIWDNLFENGEAYNPQKLYWNYFYHIWSVTAVSPFACGAVFTAGDPSVTSVEVSPATLTMGKGTSTQLTATVVTDNFAPKTVVWSITTTGIKPATKITSDGVLTIASDETKSTVAVKCTSTFDSTKFATSTITVSA